MTKTETVWTGKTVLITGGSSFIGSSLADQLIERGAKIRVVDDLTSGHLGNIAGHIATGKIEFIRADLREPGIARAAMQGVHTVFHLAADHGGRGYVDLHQAGPASNFFLDGLVFWEALKAKVVKVVFASSGCVYPNFLQSDVSKEVFLKEDLTKGPNDADNTYGWAKLMAEFTLQAYHKEHGLKAASCRYFTVYDPRGRRKNRRRHGDQPGHHGADPRHRCRQNGDGVHRAQSRSQAAAQYADGSAESRSGQFAGEETNGLGAKSAVPGRAEAHHRLVLQGQGSRARGVYLQADAYGALKLAFS